jgi:hypothetical protein
MTCASFHRARRYYHSAAVTDEGQVWTWGWGEHGQVHLRARLIPATMSRLFTPLCMCVCFHVITVVGPRHPRHRVDSA